MMDLMILVAVFVAILALAYFTYRNIVGLDTRLRKIEDVLKNAEVVAAPVHTPTHERSENHNNSEIVGEENTRIPGWGGEGPPVNVERVPSTSDEEEHDVRVMELHEDEELSVSGDSDSVDSDDDDDDADADADADGDDTDDAGVGGSDDTDGDDGDDTNGADGDDGNGENKREKSKYSSLRVNELRDALKNAGVPFPNGAKKALLISLLESNNIELSG
jgi:hypothetical protein